MTALETFNATIHGPWTTSGDDVQWRLDEDGLFFQCSRSRSDWLHNFDFAVTPYKNMPSKWYAHAGFVRLWKSAADEIMKAIDGRIPRIVAGYSQGGALATLAHEAILWESGIQPETITFGSPRVVWASRKVLPRFSGVFNYRNRGDIIPHLPPVIMGYRHVGENENIGPWAIPSHLGHYPDKYREAFK